MVSKSKRMMLAFLMAASGYLFHSEAALKGKVEASTSGERILSGQFHGVRYQAKGTAEIHQLSDGKRELRITDLKTAEGPDLRVYLIAAEDATDDDAFKEAESVELGKLKRSRGDQTYQVPDELDLTKYRAVTIWCEPFGVNFATAPLTSPQP